MVKGLLKSSLPAVKDKEGQAVPVGFNRITDAHVHIFPEKLFEAVWDWFDKFGWPIRYRIHSSSLLEFLLLRGIRHVVAFQYAHKSGIALELNAYMAEIVRSFKGKVTAMALTDYLPIKEKLDLIKYKELHITVLSFFELQTGNINRHNPQ